MQKADFKQSPLHRVVVSSCRSPAPEQPAHSRWTFLCPHHADPVRQHGSLMGSAEHTREHMRKVVMELGIAPNQLAVLIV